MNPTNENQTVVLISLAASSSNCQMLLVLLDFTVLAGFLTVENQIQNLG